MKKVSKFYPKTQGKPFMPGKSTSQTWEIHAKLCYYFPLSGLTHSYIVDSEGIWLGKRQQIKATRTVNSAIWDMQIKEGLIQTLRHVLKKSMCPD